MSGTNDAEFMAKKPPGTLSPSMLAEAAKQDVQAEIKKVKNPPTPYKLEKLKQAREKRASMKLDTLLKKNDFEKWLNIQKEEKRKQEEEELITRLEERIAKKQKSTSTPDTTVVVPSIPSQASKPEHQTVQSKQVQIPTSKQREQVKPPAPPVPPGRPQSPFGGSDASEDESPQTNTQQNQNTNQNTSYIKKPLNMIPKAQEIAMRKALYSRPGLNWL